MRITIVGCAGSFPGPHSPSSCYLVEAEGFQLLLDLGHGALGPLQRYARLADIGAVCLSHLHPDHWFDLCAYWVARTYAPGGSGPRVPVYGPAGTAHRLATAYGLADPPGMSAVFDVTTLAPGTLQIGPFRVTAAHMNHTLEAFGFRVEHGGAVLAYSGDTAQTPALVDLAHGADLLLCEASFLEGPDNPAGVHLTARQAAEHAARAGAARLILTHLVSWNDPEQTLAEASASHYGGPISLATPGQVIELS